MSLFKTTPPGMDKDGNLVKPIEKTKEEMAFAGDETDISQSVMPSFLRKKVSEGKGKKQD